MRRGLQSLYMDSYGLLCNRSFCLELNGWFSRPAFGHLESLNSNKDPFNFK